MHTRRFFATRAVFLAIALGMVNANSMAAGTAAAASKPDAASQSCLDSATPVLLLGTYHMDNPGRDIMNLQVDDVLAPKRQREIAELVDDLARFRPTKILIEAEYGNPDAQTKYSQYLAGKYELGRDEREQVAFRLARKMNLSQVYGVDFPMDLNDKGLNQLMKDDPDRANKTMQALGVDGTQEMKKQQNCSIGIRLWNSTAFRIPTKRSNTTIRSTSSISYLSPRELTMREPTWWPRGTSVI